MAEMRHVVTVAAWGAYRPETVLRVLEPGEAPPEGARFPFGFVDAGRAAQLVADGLAEWYDAAALAPEPAVTKPKAKTAQKGRG